jgi:tripartite-type tricarboxylate transporter receptor subunit TctC
MNARYSLWCSIAALVGSAVMASADAGAQQAKAGAGQWPTRPIRLIVPFPPGGATDANARAIAKGMENVLGQSIVIDNRGGANAIIGSDLVANAAPDGYTLMHISIAFAINPSTHKKLPFDTRRDFTPITNPIVGQGSLLAVNPSVPAKTVGQFIALAKKETLKYGSPGVGNVLHLITEAISTRAGIQMLHVPYKGAGPTLVAVVGGEVQVMVVPPVIAIPHLKAGRLRPLGYSGAKRLPAIAEVPTIGETLPGFQQDSGWHAWFAPAKTPAPVVARIYGAIQKSLQVPAVRDFLLAGGYQPTADPPAEFQKNFQNDLKRWGELVRLAKIKPI